MSKKNDAGAPGLSRRKFGQEAALAGVAAVLGVGAARAEARPAAETAASKGVDDEVEARFQRALQQYGDRLSDEQKKRIRKILVFNEQMLEPIRNFPLENGEAPATTLKLYPDPAAGPGSRPGDGSAKGRKS